MRSGVLASLGKTSQRRCNYPLCGVPHRVLLESTMCLLMLYEFTARRTQLTLQMIFTQGS